MLESALRKTCHRQVFIDTETTGLSPKQGHRIIELAAVEAVDGQLTGREFHSYFDPGRPIDPYAERVHGLSRDFLSGKPMFADVASEFLDFIRNADLLMHNAPFDKGFLDAELARVDVRHKLSEFGTVICTVQLAKKRFPGCSVALDALIERSELGIKREQHSALGDARLLAEIYFRLMKDGKRTCAAKAEKRDLPRGNKSTHSTYHLNPSRGTAMNVTSDLATKTYLVWQFSNVIPGTFKRNKKQFAHLDYPILAPLPTNAAKTKPIEQCPGEGPFIYFVHDGAGGLCYIGKSKEKCVIKRWVRPGIGGPSEYYWTHSTTSGGNVFSIAEGLRRNEGPFSLRYTSLSALLPTYGAGFGISAGMDPDLALKYMEDGLIGRLSPMWNH